MLALALLLVCGMGQSSPRFATSKGGRVISGLGREVSLGSAKQLIKRGLRKWGGSPEEMGARCLTVNLKPA